MCVINCIDLSFCKISEWCFTYKENENDRWFKSMGVVNSKFDCKNPIGRDIDGNSFGINTFNGDKDQQKNMLGRERRPPPCGMCGPTTHHWYTSCPRCIEMVQKGMELLSPQSDNSSRSPADSSAVMLDTL